ncbi:hypothetical protein [Actinoplanes sp. NPDC049265]|uniref:hypothetical protein n=1 Tax=Actinoplanes sp. NPDC049265 TaxID=3363902 RepID=UPI003717C2A6
MDDARFASGLTLTDENREIMAETFDWPDDALDICKFIEIDFPEWYPVYIGVDGGDRAYPPGFYAIRRFSWKSEPPAYGATDDELRAALNDWRPGLAPPNAAAADLLEEVTPVLMGLSELENQAGLGPEMLQLLSRMNIFPPPIADLASGPLWLTAELQIRFGRKLQRKEPEKTQTWWSRWWQRLKGQSSPSANPA